MQPVADRRPSGWRGAPIVRFLGSLNTGITLLVLVLLYACVFSALPQVRGAVEVTEMQAFSHWLFTTMTVLLCLSVIVATLSRIPLNLPNLGVWTVHAGILTLCGGALWYFGSKIEGDVLLRSPRIELLAGGSGMSDRAIAAVLPEKGQSWSNFMPAFGGEVALEVLDTRTSPAGGVEAATVRVTAGSDAPKTIELSTKDQAPTPVDNRLRLRLETFSGERTFYDHELAALWHRKAGEKWHTASLEGLPYFRERFTNGGSSIVDRNGKPVVSKRSRPAVALGGLSIPTGWFENWTLPVKPEMQDMPFDVEITGYLPYIAGTRAKAVAGGSTLDPGVNLRLSIPNTDQMVERSLFALRPSSSWLDMQTPFEFRWATSEAERDALLSPLAGSSELVIEVKDPPVKKTVAVAAGDTIEVEGTSYKLKIDQIMPSWPLMSPGFEGVPSPAAAVSIESDSKRFSRTVIQRFPQFTQDIDEQGVRRRDGLYDANIILTFRTAASGHVLLVADPQSIARGEVALGVFSTNGKVERSALRVGGDAPLSLPGLPLVISLVDLHEKSMAGDMPVVEPLELRRPNLGARAASAIQLELIGKGPLAGWRETRWMRFSQYPDDETFREQIRPPGSAETYELVYSRYPRDLGVTLAPQKLAVNFFPGRRSVESWRSWFSIEHDGGGREVGTVYTNQTCNVGAWTLFQSGAAEDHWSYTVLGVGNRRGIWPMLLGCTMITLGCLWAFYVKPALKRRAAGQVLEQERERTRGGGNGGGRQSRAESREVVHAG